MNEPIISPWIFYLISLADRVSGLLFLMSLFSFVGLVISGFLYAAGASNDMDDDDRKRYVKSSKFIAYCFLISAPITVFIPSEETIYKMLITSQITPNNIEYLKNEVKATGQGLVDSITDASIKIIKAKESKQ